METLFALALKADVVKTEAKPKATKSLAGLTLSRLEAFYEGVRDRKIHFKSHVVHCNTEDDFFFLFQKEISHRPAVMQIR